MAEMGAARLATIASSSPRRVNDAKPKSVAGRIAVIDERRLSRDLLKSGLESVGEFEVTTAPTVDEWIDRSKVAPATLVVVCLPSSKPRVEAKQKLAALLPALQGTPVVVMGDDKDDVEYVMWFLEQGVRGYIATDLPLDVAFQAMRLVSAGGTYVPVSCVFDARRDLRPARGLDSINGQVFTARQAAVVDALRRGKANKTIAYELNMRESTVKVHVRNIMKKLKAKNRTEVAYMTNDMLR
jgi:DNA-binding NarL/FixJ family response regulator